MHLWAGVLAALDLIVVSVTGAALMFRIHLQRAVHPDLFVESAGELAEPVEVMETVRDAYPGGRVSGVDAPTTDRRTYLAYVTSGERFQTILADRVSGSVLGELPEHSVVRTLQDLHVDLLGEDTKLTPKVEAPPDHERSGQCGVSQSALERLVGQVVGS